MCWRTEVIDAGDIVIYTKGKTYVCQTDVTRTKKLDRLLHEKVSYRKLMSQGQPQAVAKLWILYAQYRYYEEDCPQKDKTWPTYFWQPRRPIHLLWIDKRRIIQVANKATHQKKLRKCPACSSTICCCFCPQLKRNIKGPRTRIKAIRSNWFLN